VNSGMKDMFDHLPENRIVKKKGDDKSNNYRSL
jgi:hypothetical protein